MRGQLNGLKTLIDALPPGATVEQLNDAVNMLGEDINAVANNLTAQIEGTALNPSDVANLGITVSDPPTQSEVQAIADTLDQLITALKRA